MPSRDISRIAVSERHCEHPAVYEDPLLNRTRVGLLGAGYIVKSHADALRAIDTVELHAVCDLSIGRARAVATEYGIPEVFDSIEALAASACDVVHVLLPPSHHINAARQLLAAGKHVFLEKPMGLSGDECQEIADLAKARGLKLGVNHNFLFSPAYQEMREAVKSGRAGAVDHLTVNWLYALPILQFGPFNNWMVAAPGNIIFELVPHLAAFAVDLIGPVEVQASVADNPIDLPGDQRVYRRWTAIGRNDRAGLTLNLSITPGQTDRSLSLRSLGTVAHFDFDKGIAWQEAQASDNPIFDNVQNARRTARVIKKNAGRDFRRYIGRLLRKEPGANPFEESVRHSIAAFYNGLPGEMDPRLTGDFGANVIRLCEAIVAKAGHAKSASSTAKAALPASPERPHVLVIGGTGFIGRRLVKALADRGVGVRVLTRDIGSARIDLAGLPVDLVQGSHSDAALLDRALHGIDNVYHLAKADGKRWQDYVTGDIEPTRLLAEACLKHGIKRFIYTGTIDSYASANGEDRITGDTPVDPAIASRNHYARSKAACEALLKDLAKSRGLPLVIFRPGVVIGEGSPPAHMGVGHFVSPTQIDYWGDGINKLPFVLVDDVAEALALALDAKGIDGQTFLLTDAPLLSARDYVAAMEARAGRIAAAPKPIWRHWVVDLVKQAAKQIVRHPNRRGASYHDWNCRAHRARYDSSKTCETLGWKPAGTKDALIERGLNASIDRFLR